jgi:hypothetical protein
MPSTTLGPSALALASMLAVSTSACTSDQIVAPSTSQAAPSAPQENIFTAHATFQRYVAIGTSISAGVQSDGLIAATQVASWPAQLSGMALSSLKQPLIAGTGCPAPIIAPLLLDVRLSGEPAAVLDASSLNCSPLLFGLAPPFDNVSLNGALTSDALGTTPSSPGNPNAKIYRRVLQPGMTQVSTMIARNPTLVSVELGSNEVLGATSGTTALVFPEAAWEHVYDQVINAVPTTSRGVLVGLIDHLADVQAFRLGDDLWQDRLEFALFNVQVSPDCQSNQNLIFVSLKAPLTVATGLAQAQHGLGPATLSCTDAPGQQDFILTPADAGFIDGQVKMMNAHIQMQATARGFAYFPLGALYDTKNAKAPFSVVKLLTSAAPFGPYFSLDGLHPSVAGQAILARAAAQALNATYGLGIPIL